ncbi:flavin monoamine oxidase family protein [Rouxiella sp. Mn2063]|uniref:flavin monoamine oxidase family protein n=1 Tax=Rouxiella sp. Mn2063 TaxID=3395262 RepID=UPI003BEA8D59
MKRTQVAIIGAGISGLYAASLLMNYGVDFVLLEGRETVGGRALSPVSLAEHSVDDVDKMRVDLGATWVWPALQHQLVDIFNGLGIALTAQNEHGDLLYEQAHHLRPSRHSGYVSAPPAMRLVGGMQVLAEKLKKTIPSERIYFQHSVFQLQEHDNQIMVHSLCRDGQTSSLMAEHILLALPPALACAMEYIPPLPTTLAHQWANTATWMAAHAKYVAVYETPFWRADGLSGEARSSAGPMAEIHDASTPGGVSALFGFLGVPATTRRTISEESLKTLCRAQLTRLFGEAAAKPQAEYFKDWAVDPFTAHLSDLTLLADHAVVPAAADQGFWQHRLQGIASEWSSLFPGYIAGAIEAAQQGVQDVVQQHIQACK